MKLNLGGGDDRREGYINVDLRQDCADVLADVQNLPFSSNSASDILALDILEHLPPSSTMSVLRHWYSILEPGGELTLRVPNMYQLSRALARYYENVQHDVVEMLIMNIYGGQRWGTDGEWDRHYWGWTPVGLATIVKETGFTVTHCDEALNMTMMAIKP
jgi:SAM-dependent methyltransferase